MDNLNLKDKITMYKLADKLGMSVSSISRAFNPDTKLKPEKRKLILEAAEELGYKPNKMASRLSMKYIRIGVLIYGYIESYYREAIAGIEAAYKELKGYKVIYELQLLKNINHSIKDALSVIDDFSFKKCDGIIISGIYGEEISKKIFELTENGIRIVILNNEFPKHKGLFTVGNNIEIAVKTAVHLLRIYIKHEGKKVIMFSGNMKSPLHSAMITQFRENLIHEGLILLDYYDTMDNPAVAEIVANEAFAKHNDVDGIYISSANSIPILKYIEGHDLAGKIAVVTSDVFSELNYYIENGTVNATIYQNPYLQGRKAFENLYFNIAESIEIEEKIEITPIIVMKCNLSMYQ